MQVMKRKCYMEEFMRSKDDQIILEGLDKYSADISDLIAQTPGPDLPLLLATMMQYQRVIEQTVPGTIKMAERLNFATDATVYVMKTSRNGERK